MAYYAHSQNPVGERHLLSQHLHAVASLAHGYAQGCPWVEEAKLSGLLHDLGKYGDRFQKRLEGKDQGLDHWSAGAWLALSEYGAVAAALAIQGHHIGLQNLYCKKADWVGALHPDRLDERHPLSLALSEKNMGELKARLGTDGILPIRPKQTVLGSDLSCSLSRMLDVRMLFSTLVDADFLDTEAHFKGNAQGKAYRTTGPELQAERALEILLEEIDRLVATTQAVENVAQVRQQLRADCLKAAENAPGLFTLTAPTGSGKTLAMLAFALAHAQKHGLRRVIMVIPYLSIIEQTARIYRDIFQPHFGEDYVLEHHSMAGRGKEQRETDDEGAIESQDAAERRRRLLTENWDAPLVVTTSVQALESLFSNRPSACRKLHRLARSVILFDEAQTLPPGLAVPSLAALSQLAHAYGASVVFSTATQPAFEHLDKAVTQHSAKGWQPRPIVPSPERLFAPMLRVQVNWPEPSATLAWPELADKLCESEQSLCIVNLKKHAQALWQAVGAGFSPRLANTDETGLSRAEARSYDENAFHLSTNLCPAHRRDVLDAVRKLLKEKLSVRLIATQCIEAGVDVDFPVVWRALAPLDAIIQAAGRCNREGLLDWGQAHVFMPDLPAGDGLYPSKGYEQAAAVTSSLLMKHGREAMKLDDPAFITAYYRELYDISRPEISKKTRQIEEYINAGAFPEIAQEYRLIDQDTINIVVPYGAKLDEFQSLRDKADGEGLTSEWIRQACSLAVSVYRPKYDDPLWDSLIPVLSKRQRGKKQREDWFIAARPEHYHPKLGYQPPKAFNIWMA